MKPIKYLISRETRRKIGQRRQLEFIVSNATPAPLNSHISASEINGTLLHVLADSQAWASEFRYRKREIIARLSNYGDIEVTDIRVRVSRPTDQPSHPKRPSTKRQSISTVNPHIARMREILDR